MRGISTSSHPCRLSLLHNVLMNVESLESNSKLSNQETYACKLTHCMAAHTHCNHQEVIRQELRLTARCGLVVAFTAFGTNVSNSNARSAANGTLIALNLCRTRKSKKLSKLKLQIPCTTLVSVSKPNQFVPVTPDGFK